MKKSKIKTTKPPTIRHKVTTRFGYGLFAFIALTLVTATLIPMSSALQYPTARHFNIITLMIAFAIATILPALAAYFIGDRATKSKKSTLHHYNGVLFGLAAFWLSLAISWFQFAQFFGVTAHTFPQYVLVSNILPVVLAIGVLCIVAMLFAKDAKKNTSVLHYRPFQIVLLVATIGAITIPYIVFEPTVQFGTFAGFGIVFAAILTAYAVLRRQHSDVWSRLTDATIAMSIGWLASMVSGGLLSIADLPYQLTTVLSWVLGVLVFAAYLFLRIRR